MSPSLRRAAVRVLLAFLALTAGASTWPAAGAAAVGAEASTTPAVATPATPPNFLSAFAQSLRSPGTPPPGADDPTCVPSPEHPRPVVLLHGTFANPYNSFAAMAPALRAQGYCVFAPALGRSPIRGIDGWQSVDRSVAGLSTAIDGILARTGAAQVDLVGYSQGGLVARAYLTDPALGTARRARVHTLVGLSVPNHGTDPLGVAQLVRALNLRQWLRGTLGQGALDLLRGSSFMGMLTARGEVIPGVATTMLATVSDEFSKPHNRATLAGSAEWPVTNLLLQRGCPIDLSDHFTITYSPRSIAVVLRALDPAAAPRIPLPCSWRLPLL